MTILPASRSGTAGRSLRRTARAAAALAGACVLLIVQPVFADELADVTRMLRAGQASEAMAKIEAFLEKNPRDVQMRFVKGVVLTEQGKANDAIAVFTKLTADHPDLPEPYNNLAVLFAASGQYDKARAALDMAIRTNPSYATAYENLGDVHAKLASQAYDKAMQLDSGNANARSKLTLLKTLTVNAAGKDTGSKTAAAPARPVAIAASSPAPVVVARLEPARDASVVAVAEPKPAAETKPRPEPKPDAKPEPKADVKPLPKAKPDVKPEPKADAKPEIKAQAKPDTKADGKPEPKAPARPAASPENDEVMAAVTDWAAAWSAQDVKRYLSHYGNDFETPKGESRKAWVDERTARISGKGRINVKVATPEVTINGNSATVKFRQVYSSDRLQADSRKTLVMTKQGGKWQIKQERSGA